MATAKRGKPTYRAPALEKGLDILEVLAESSIPLSQAELAQKLGRSQGEFFRMLTCLEGRGYVAREAESGRFRLSLRLYELGHKQSSTGMLRNAARLPMERLADETGQACHLSVQSGPSTLILMERMPSQRVCLAVGEGTAFPLVETTSGKLLLSQMDADHAKSILNNDRIFAAKSTRGRNAVLREIEVLRDSGFAITKSITTEGVTDMAMPVGVHGTDTAAVLVMPYLTGAHQKKQSHERYIAALRGCAAQINRNLGISGAA